jgi:polysaccharide deacetylase family protein (PEP-CTERM system associated)
VKIVNAFTVDLEDWFQGLTSTNPHPEAWATYEARLEGSTARLLALLDKHDVKATFFVLGHVADQYPDLIRQLDAAGHEIGVHGYWHQMVHRLTPERFAAELDRALEVLTPLVRQPPIGHRAPYFSINGQCLWALDVLRDRGFRYDSSFFPTRNMLYGYPEAPRFPCRVGNEGSSHRGDGGDMLVEFPVSTARWLGINWPIGGGFYVRALPYGIIRSGIRQLHRQQQAAILYMHPWELDTEQHYDKVTLRERVTHYSGRRRLNQKLERLFGEFAFLTLRDLLDQGWQGHRESHWLK